MNASTALELLRAGLAILGAVRSWQNTATPAQLKEYVEGIRGPDGNISLADVDALLADVKAGGAALDAKIAAAQAKP